MNTWQFHFVKLVKGGSYAAYLYFFVYIGLFVAVFPHLHGLNLTYCSKSSLLLAFCFLFVYVTGITEMCTSLVSLLELFQRIICVIERMKEGSVSTALLGGAI